MHVVQLTTAREYYGGEVCLRNLAAGLDARGHRVTCVVRPDSELRGVLERDGLATCLHPLVDWYEPVSMARLSRWLRRQTVDVLHTHRPRDWFIAATATVGTSIRNVASRHVLQPVTHARFKRPFLDRLHRMIAVSEAVGDGLRRSRLVADDRVVTVANGLARSGECEPALSLRTRAGVPPGVPVIGTVGRLCEEKGVDVLLRAAAALRERRPDLRVFVVGDATGGPGHAAYLRRLAADLGLGEAVTFFGYVPDAAAACADFDVQVVCSRAEPFGLATVEAMLAERPVVVTDTGGSPEIVRDGVEGFLVPPGDAGALALRLDCLLDSPGLRREMGRRGRLRAEERFGLDRMVDAVERVYRDTLVATS